MGANPESISAIRSQFEKREMLNESLHEYVMRLFRFYLIVGGMPEAVNQFVQDQNSALDKFISNEAYSVKDAIVLCNRREVKKDKDGITYMPVYYAMFVSGNNGVEDVIMPLPSING